MVPVASCRGSVAAHARARRAGCALLWVVGLAVAACSSASAPEAATPGALAPAAEGVVRRFAFTALDGSVVTSGSLRGRMTLVVLVASYDDASQAQTLFVRSLVRRHVPRINALLLVLEPEHHRPMVEAFADTLELRFPVVWADEHTIAGKGPFPGLHHVPSVVLLDRESREVWRHVGLVEEGPLEQALQQHEGR